MFYILLHYVNLRCMILLRQTPVRSLWPRPRVISVPRTGTEFCNEIRAWIFGKERQTFHANDRSEQKDARYLREEATRRFRVTTRRTVAILQKCLMIARGECDDKSPSHVKRASFTRQGRNAAEATRGTRARARGACKSIHVAS